MRIAVLTSSRADFGIYLPLLKALRSDDFFNLKIIAFGTHLSDFHGKTINQIAEEGFTVDYTVETTMATDSASSISGSMGLTMIRFSEFWKNHVKDFDLTFCLGDRYEMFAAVSAGIPFNIKFAHLHGGETTLGAIDNVFRHAITLAAKLHFVSTASHAERVEELIQTKDGIYNVGALSLDNIKSIKLLTLDEFKEKWGIDLTKKTILTTFHPETVNIEVNALNTANLIKAIEDLNQYQFIITMPNADTAGNMIRAELTKYLGKLKNVFLIENLGSQSYFTSLKHVSFLLGNTSSGILEAASFNKFVINLGDRQLGRSSGENVIHTQIETRKILKAIKRIEKKVLTDIVNIYDQGGAAGAIINVLKAFK